MLTLSGEGGVTNRATAMTSAILKALPVSRIGFEPILLTKPSKIFHSFRTISVWLMVVRLLNQLG